MTIKTFRDLVTLYQCYRKVLTPLGSATYHERLLYRGIFRFRHTFATQREYHMLRQGVV